MADDDLLERRRRALLPGYELSYDAPLHIVRAEGVWMFNPDGRAYLDCYNNVPSVGHCHPRVVEAIARQASTLNTHTRYLHENVVELAERVVATLPEDLSTALFVCTGTEANDVAVQMARAATGHHGVIVSEASYHGNSTLVRHLSTLAYPAEERPSWVAAVEPPNTHRGPFQTGDDDDLARSYAASVQDAVDELVAAGHGVAALLVDSVWDSNGVLVPPARYVRLAQDIVKAAGGVLIADEVQAGYCRTGSHFWGFSRHDVVPDIVTTGKPMGAGHPIAAIATSTAIATAFTERVAYFNTFGGNPVSAAAALAVLDVIEDEGLLARAEAVGAGLGASLRDLQDRHLVVSNVQGAGLFWGVDLVADADGTPLPYGRARRLATEIARNGVLVGVTGRYGNVLKVRPPLVIGATEADRAVEVIDACLASVEVA